MGSWLITEKPLCNYGHATALSYVASSCFCIIINSGWGMGSWLITEKPLCIYGHATALSYVASSCFCIILIVVEVWDHG